ncbi:MAG: diguanylate cyclase, partial [Pseudomonadota bacterium]|nr:diguanylate cyclase [Pseudomonadota bacterium]
MGESATVLIVDDNPANLDLLVRVLEGEPYELVAARSGESAVDLVPKVRPDLILMDVAMPGMNGYETCSRIKKNEAYADIPLIFVTAKADICDLAKGYSVGCVDYIRKPIQKEEVILRVRTHLQIRLLNDKLRRHNEQLASILAVVMEGTFSIDPHGRIGTANPAALKQLGYTKQELVGRSIGEIAPGLAGTEAVWKDSALYQICREGGEFCSQSYVFRKENGKDFHAEFTAAALEGEAGQVIGAIVAFRDISDFRESQQRLVSLMSTDTLTGLVNWSSFRGALTDALAGCESGDHTITVYLLDLDDFRDVNDCFGHDMGDVLLTLVADRLRERFPRDVLITRLGGDEFALMVDGSKRADSTEEIAGRIFSTLSRPFDLGENRVYVSTSVGVASSAEVPLTAEDMIRAADTAVFRAKEHGKNTCQNFSVDMQRHVQERMRTAGRLRKGLDKDEFFPFFQPLVDANSRRVLGAEALLRWRKGEQVVPTAQFIEVAERSGLIDELGSRVLYAACGEARRWRDNGHDLHVSVNVSARQLRNPEFSAMVFDTLDDAGLPPSSLVLELTEST